MIVQLMDIKLVPGDPARSYHSREPDECDKVFVESIVTAQGTPLSKRKTVSASVITVMN